LQQGTSVTVTRRYFPVYLPLILRNYPPIYTISGQVKNTDNAPVSNVTISTRAGYMATTDGNGDYILRGLPAGNYAITPSKVGYTFSPASALVQVPPDAAGRNFTATLSAFTINSTADAIDAHPGDGICATNSNVCTLRAAIQEANARPGSDTIVLPAGAYVITIPGMNEDVAATGDLDLLDNLTISGAGTDISIVDGNALDAVFGIPNRTGSPITVTLSGLTIQDGLGGVVSSGYPADPGPRQITLQNSTVTNNAGNGLDLFGIKLTLNDSVVTNNTGAGVWVSEGNVIVSSSTVSGNSKPGYVGGIRAILDT
jgi:CSLREA domain-containing protein